jgi:hypothetical protein
MSQGHLQCNHLHTKFYLNPPIGSKVIKGFLCTHLRSLNVRHFGMAEAMGLRNMALRSPSMSPPFYQFHESPLIGS